jgi:hypothetical protein
MDDRFEQVGRFRERLLGLPTYDRNGSFVRCRIIESCPSAAILLRPQAEILQ